MPAGLEAGCFVEPTLFADVKPEDTIAQEEIFGPVLAVMRAAALLGGFQCAGC